MAFYDYRVSSPYGERNDPFTGKKTMHNGIDYAIPENTPITSNVKGTVTNVNTDDSHGLGIYVDVYDGTNYHRYAHLNSANVKVMQKVDVNEVIGLSGSTGRSTGPHLEYSVLNSNYQYIDPTRFTKENSSAEGETMKQQITDSFLSHDIAINSELVPDNMKPVSSNYESPWYDIEGRIREIIEDLKQKLKIFLFNLFKFVIIALLIVLFVVFVARSLDIEIKGD